MFIKESFSEQILHSVKPRELHLIDPWKYESSEEYNDAWYGGKAQGGQAEMDERTSKCVLVSVVT